MGSTLANRQNWFLSRCIPSQASMIRGLGGSLAESAVHLCLLAGQLLSLSEPFQLAGMFTLLSSGVISQRQGPDSLPSQVPESPAVCLRFVPFLVTMLLWEAC